LPINNQKRHEKKHNYFYKITNLINGKFYYGIHSTDNLNDGYWGSGRALKQAIIKYGKENFSKEILFNYKTRKEVSDHEKMVVTMDLVLDEKCYNLKTGGDNENVISKLSNHPSWKSGKDNPLYGYKHSEKFGNDISIRQSRENNSFYGKNHTLESKDKISKANIGKLNSFYGKKHPPEIMQQIILNNPNRKPCEIKKIKYISIADAHRQLNISYNTIKTRLNSDKWSEWKYI
jgi:group I intron endonuclease